MNKKSIFTVLALAALLALGAFVLFYAYTGTAVARDEIVDCGPDPGNDKCRISETSTPISNNGVVPEHWNDNPNCQDMGFGYGFKLNGAPNGTFNLTSGNGELTGGGPEDTFNSVTVSSDGIFASWSSTLAMDAVFIKGGNEGGNLYIYYPESTDPDSGLSTPTEQGISHIEFCYDYELDVTKNANTSFTRTFEWTIEKSVTPESWDLFTGDRGTSEYSVSVTKTGFTDSGWAVSGSITIDNNTPLDATITRVTDEVSPTIAATVECGVAFPYVLPAGGTLPCTYSAALPDGSDRTNRATVTTNGNVGGNEATADVVFGEPTTLVNDSINVSDTNGESWVFNDTGSQTYERTFTCDEDEGIHNNTATIVETGQSNSASVNITCYALDVTKNARTSLTRTWNWTIDKSVTPAIWDLFTGDSGTSKYTVSVDRVDFTDSSWAVTGDIRIDNPNPTRDATLTAVSDLVSPDIAATVDCPSLTVPAGDSLYCTYSADLPDGTSRTNTASATLQNYAYAADGTPTEDGTTDFTGSASVDFSGATITEVNASITVDDTNGGTWTFSDSGSVMYQRTFACDGDEGTHDNSASIRETGQSDNASVDVNCYALTVTKDADPELTRTWTWTIDKSADQTNLLLSQGQLFQVNYEVMVNATSADSEWTVKGDIWIGNPHPSHDATLTDVSDIVSPDIAASVVCPSLAVPSGGSLHCTYSADLPDDSTRTNTATATLQNYAYNSEGVGTPSGTTDFSGSTSVDFSNATISEIDECIDVSDTNVGFLGTVCAGDAPRTFSYSLWFGRHPDADVLLECGNNTHTNIADFVANDTAATGQDDWTVTADVVCDVGCTLTPGYWKTHSREGPAPYDDTWQLLDPDEEDTIFFLSNQTYFEVLWTSPQGNAYYILAHAYIAAELNQLNGVTIPIEVMDAFDEATALFSQYTPKEVAEFKGKNGKEIRDQFIHLAEVLDDYNNGLLGPGHCSE